MSNEIFQAIEQVGREKGIEVDIIIQAVEDAYAAAAKKYFRTKEDLGARFDRDTGSLAVFARKKIVDDVTNPDLEISPNEAEEMTLPANEEGIVEIPKPKEELAQLGRIAAQAAKQIIFQKVREAERDNVYKEYIGRAGELVNGVVKRFERGSIIIDLGRTEGILPKKEQSKAERYSQGDRVRAVIVDVDRNAKGPQVILSRTDERLLIKLFEMEVPEIYDGTVQIERAVHDPGDRAKVAVRSKDRDVDPVGACVGMKGSRVQSIIRELRGEKIDIIPYSEETVAFAQKALSPAKVTRVQITDPENKKLEVIVEDSQLSLAIGKKGQNVRLASKLIGWDIDIKSEEEKRQEIEEQMTALTAPTTPLTALAGVGAKTIEKIEAAGITNVEKLAGMTPEQLMEIPGIGEKMVDKIYQAVNRFYEGGAEAAAAAPAGENADDMVVEGETAQAENEATPAGGEAAAESNEVSAKSREGAGSSDETATAAEAESETATSAAGEETPSPEHSEGGEKTEEEPRT